MTDIKDRKSLMQAILVLNSNAKVVVRGDDDIDKTTNYGHGANGIIDIAKPSGEYQWTSFDLQGLVNNGDIDWGMDAPAKYIFLLLQS